MGQRCGTVSLTPHLQDVTLHWRDTGVAMAMPVGMPWGKTRQVSKGENESGHVEQVKTEQQRQYEGR